MSIKLITIETRRYPSIDNVIINGRSGRDVISELINNEKNTGFNIQRYNKCKNKQNDDLKKEIWKMEQMGMDKESIYKAMNPENYDD